MEIVRLCRSIMINILGGGRQTKYLKKHHVFHSMGERCSFNLRLVPLYPELISFGDNVNIASGVSFHTHDGMNNLINKMNPAPTRDGAPARRKCQEGLGCIKIGSNVSIASRVVINYGVQIGDNVIIAAGTVVDKDIPSNSVVRGIPAEVICSFDQFVRMRRLKRFFPDELSPVMGKSVSKELVNYMWDEFNKNHNI